MEKTTIRNYIEKPLSIKECKEIINNRRVNGNLVHDNSIIKKMKSMEHKKTIIGLLIIWVIIVILGIIFIYNIFNNDDSDKKLELLNRIEFCETKIGIWFYRDQCNQYGECYQQYLDCNNILYQKEDEVKYATNISNIIS